MSTWLKRPRRITRERATQGALLNKHPLSLWGMLFLAPFLLAGCAERAVSGSLALQQQETIPDSKVVDFRLAACGTLWQLDEQETLENSLYWLRAMECAESLSANQARALAKTVENGHWDGAFKQAILLGAAQPVVAERRQQAERVNSYSLEFPNALRPLLQIWSQQQALQIALADEKARYQRLQESSDSQIDALRQSQLGLQTQLQETSRKLENLTDIERRLSSRKQLQGDIPENATRPDNSGKGSAPAKKAALESMPEKGTALPVEPEDSEMPLPDNKESDAQ